MIHPSLEVRLVHFARTSSIAARTLINEVLRVGDNDCALALVRLIETDQIA